MQFTKKVILINSTARPGVKDPTKVYYSVQLVERGSDGITFRADKDYGAIPDFSECEATFELRAWGNDISIQCIDLKPLAK